MGVVCVCFWRGGGAADLGVDDNAEDATSLSKFNPFSLIDISIYGSFFVTVGTFPLTLMDRETTFSSTLQSGDVLLTCYHGWTLNFTETPVHYILSHRFPTYSAERL